MVEVGRYLWRLPGPTPCSGRATWSRLPRTISRQGGRSHNLSGQPVLMVCHPHIKNYFLMFIGMWCPHAHCLLSCPWTPLKRAWLPLLCTLPSNIYTHWGGNTPPRAAQDTISPLWQRNCWLMLNLALGTFMYCSWSSCRPIPPACSSPSEWQHNPLVFQNPSQLWMCWGCAVPTWLVATHWQASPGLRSGAGSVQCFYQWSGCRGWTYPYQVCWWN